MCRSTWVLLALSLLAVRPAGAAETAPAPTDGTAPVAEAPKSAEDNAAAEAEAMSTINRELLTAEEQVDQTKERVFRAKATLQLLREIVVEGSSNGGKLTIRHANKLGGGFTLEAVTYLLDGQSKLAKSDASGSLDQNRDFEVSSSTLAPGPHTISVEFKVRPTGFGVFKYAKNYTIDVRDTYPLTLELGKACTVTASISEKGGAVDKLEERAKVEYDMKCETIDAK